mgnify:CR=1 FL=1
MLQYLHPFGTSNIENLEVLNDNKFGTDGGPVLLCYDQEPLNFDLYKDRKHNVTPEIRYINPSNLNAYRKLLLLHSEQNSTEIEKYRNMNFIPVYYWSHALIALDWFRYAQHQAQEKYCSKTFLIYNRAWSGTREYRLEFMESLVRLNLVDYCNKIGRAHV